MAGPPPKGVEPLAEGVVVNTVQLMVTFGATQVGASPAPNHAIVVPLVNSAVPGW